MEPKQVELSGQVVRERVDAGSKSERETVVLKAEDGATYVLRQRGGPAYGDNSLDALVGSSITTKAFKIDQTLIMQDWHLNK
ncbi:hypothetical protein [Bradyrhizobium sp. JYMT SZCCT0428]|uniref:hypothetical protein n=1 Tax=Bradyrhizobium sp. JYMT SZCCT0428 TaxID=2807673 RepID=UPI001BAC4B36|nr:hypothetical protein [Bradyrhizobium sp. JYMT SZCCT0428]MBR1155150.1 hypothetical protein [Bradyrhizobium sp. JYMT SZCCT0428]